MGVDPVQFGMILMMNLGLGLTTPPVGGCLFVGCAIAKVRIESVMPDDLALLPRDPRGPDADDLRARVISLGLPRLMGY